MNIVHISDLHFGHDKCAFPWRQLQELLSDKVKALGDDTYLVLSGDITLKGSQVGFDDAQKFFSSLIKSSGINRSHILMCPGNHDFSKGENPPFSAFSTFAYAVRRDNEFDYSKYTFHAKKIGNVFFLFANSAHHLDHTYGYVDPDLFRFLEEETSRFEDCSHRVFVTHHHLLGQYQNDTSAIRNAYQLLYSLDKAGFGTLFHGHQHSNQAMPIGESRMNLVSARSFNFVEDGIVNGVNICLLTDGILTSSSYAVIGDDNPNKLIFSKA